MSKLNQKIVLFIGPDLQASDEPSKIGNLFMNRFAIEEDAKNEIFKISFFASSSIANRFINKFPILEGSSLACKAGPINKTIF